MMKWFRGIGGLVGATSLGLFLCGCGHSGEAAPADRTPAIPSDDTKAQSDLMSLQTQLADIDAEIQQAGDGNAPADLLRRRDEINRQIQQQVQDQFQQADGSRR
jgi:hypothetical protein